MGLWQFVSLDLPPLLAAVFSSVACALLGTYLVLRRVSLMGDAIAHSVLPGIVVAFLLTSSRDSFSVFLGAAVAGILSAVLIEAVRRFGNVETGAAMGVIFSIFFALGVLLIEQAAARNIDLDADCLLHGQLESIFWSPPTTIKQFMSLETLATVPSEIWTTFLTMLVVIAFVTLLRKELKLAAFDPALADSLGFSSRLIFNALMVLVACAVVASFKVVGSILVIAMLVCPAAAARLLTDRLSVQLILSAAIAILCAVIGYVLGAFGPFWIGYEHSVNTAGMISVAAGALLGLSVAFAPRHGVLARAVRHRRLAITVRKQDILALLYRAEESVGEEHFGGAARSQIIAAYGPGSLTTRALHSLESENAITRDASQAVSLTQTGRTGARELVRSHRLWESFLVREVGLAPDHVHSTAEQLEHFTDAVLREKVAETEGAPTVDPHGKEIP